MPRLFCHTVPEQLKTLKDLVGIEVYSWSDDRPYSALTYAPDVIIMDRIDTVRMERASRANNRNIVAHCWVRDDDASPRFRWAETYWYMKDWSFQPVSEIHRR